MWHYPEGSKCSRDRSRVARHCPEIDMELSRSARGGERAGARSITHEYNRRRPDKISRRDA